jgi:GNAT superfamily N-acetyltransferase
MSSNNCENDARMSGVQCRKVSLSDIPLLRAWYSDQESRHQLYAAPEDDTEFAYYMLQPHRFMVVSDGVPVATFRIEEQGAAAVLGLLVGPEFRGMGFAKKALEFAEKKARELGFHVLSVDIYSDNMSALSAFSSAGFREFIWYEKNI